MNLSVLLPDILAIAKNAGEAILEVYHRDHRVEIQIKADATPVTEADLVAHQLICRSLAELTPDIPVLSEESAATIMEERHQWTRFWLIDPLDGTKEFIKRNGEFTVNIALIDQGHSVLGVVYTPVTGVAYTGLQGMGANKITTNTRLSNKSTTESAQTTKIQTRSLNKHRPLDLVTSRSHISERLESYIKQLEAKKDISRRPMGSSLKLCLLAEGQADIHVRLGRTCEWDTAAAQAVLEAAGGKLMDLNFEPLHYNQKIDLYNPDFIAVGDSQYDWPSLLSDIDPNTGF